MSEGTKKAVQPRKYRLVRGQRDLLPSETYAWIRAERIAHELFSSFGFGELRTPILEIAELFEKSIGTDTDVGGKELYYWVDSPRANKAIKSVRWKSKMTATKVSEPDSAAKLELLRAADAGDFDMLPQTDRVALRPEATASVCRAYIEHEMQALPQPVKLYCIGPMFRRERPQKGRYRQFYQIDAEVLEVIPPDVLARLRAYDKQETQKQSMKDAAIDAEVIEMVMTFFDQLGLEGVQLEINCIGDKKCRPKYVEKLRAELSNVKDKLGPDSQRRIETNPLRVLDSKLESEQKFIEGMPHIADHLCEECAENYRGVKKELELRGVKYRENWRLVRGLDYYSRTTFEITAKGLGSQNAVCGGGRYDGLMELLGGPPTRATGFAIGEDRLILSLQEAGKTPAPQGRDVYIAWMGEKAYATAIRAAKNLRAAGLSVELPPVEQKFGKALGQADKLGARYALILGDNEISSGEWTLKTLATGGQQKLTEPDLLNFLKREKPKADPSLPHPSEPKPGSPGAPVRSG